MSLWEASLAIRSAASLFFANSFILAFSLSGQLTTGIVEGSAQNNAPVEITGGAGFRLTIHTDSAGKFSVTLPYGEYQFSGMPVYVAPLQVSHLDLTDTNPGPYPEGFSLPAVLLSREPLSVTEPLDFTGLNDNRLAVESRGGISWTDTRFTLQGMDATDSYQPGLPMILPNIEDMRDIVVSQNDVGLFLSEADTTWHAKLSTMDTGSALSSTNLPTADQGFLKQREYFNRMTRDGLEVSGPIWKRADVFSLHGDNGALKPSLFRRRETTIAADCSSPTPGAAFASRTGTSSKLCMSGRGSISRTVARRQVSKR